MLAVVVNEVLLPEPEVVVRVEAEVVPGSVLVTPVGGRLTVVAGSVVWCGGSLCDLEATFTLVVREEVSVPMMVNAGLMSPEVPNTMLWEVCKLRKVGGEAKEVRMYAQQTM